ncbi:acyl-CoA thioesterase [Marinifilum flexuosum]|uniref:Acyl-CoA thioester hydrolase n=1 Tax=Marinifilum flexuosum TaxID=1117708 RepID=A0A419XB30_9BACT|nr:acyl-CoA thioesterase [Marinifilum flexuosum]RKE04967.1 acyl-CoA thioester hydrolase [Marinifilum flexuosum]
MIEGECRIRPRYGEVDQMGYVYHANYVDYCHFARTELMRSFGINDKVLEENGIMMPVIEMNLKYKKPTAYDEELLVITRIPEMPLTRFKFNFEFRNQKNELVCKANSTLAFVKSDSRKPIKVPEMVLNSLKEAFVM